MYWYNITFEQMKQRCKDHPGMEVQPIYWSRNDIAMSYGDERVNVRDKHGGASLSLMGRSGARRWQEITSWQVAPWSEFKPNIELDKVIIETDQSRSVAKYLAEKYDCWQYAIDNHRYCFVSSRHTVTSTSLLEDLPNRPVITHQEFLEAAPDFVADATDDTAAKAKEAAIRRAYSLPITLPIITQPEVLTREQAHEEDRLLEYVRANRDKVGLKAAWQQKEEREQAMLKKCAEDE